LSAPAGVIAVVFQVSAAVAAKLFRRARKGKFGRAPGRDDTPHAGVFFCPFFFSRPEWRIGKIHGA
jgi:hypothetical protein